MAFAITLYKHKKEVNSTKRPTGAGTTVQCISNADFDVLAPRLPLNIDREAHPDGYNYLYVPAWRRYYWINRWVFEGGLWTAYCRVDALASWKTDIGNTYAYVLRAAAAYDSSLIDNMYPTQGGPTVDRQGISTGWWSASDLDYDHGTFICGLINKEGATDYVYMTPTQFKQFAAAAFSDYFYNSVASNTTWMTKAIFDPMQYLSSVTWFPLLPTGGTATTAKLGYWTVKDENGNSISCYQAATYIDRTAGPFTIPKHPQAATRGPWVNNAPYSTYVLETWPFGFISIDPALLYGHSSIYLRMTVDYISGAATLRVSVDGLTGNIVALGNAQLGINVQISQVIKNTWGEFTGAIGGAAGAIGSLMTGNVAGAISSGLGAITSSVEASFPNVTTKGVNAGFAGLYGTWRLVGKFYSLAAEDITHRGRPLCQVRKLSTLPGYQVCTDTDVEITCTRDEMDEIRGYLESGYYYE